MTTARGTTVGIGTPDGVADAYLTHPAHGLPRPAVLIFSDAFGPRPHVRSMADRLAEAADRTVLLPNFLYRHGRAPVVALPDVIDHRTRGEVWKELRPLLRSHTTPAALRDAGAYLDWLANCPRAVAGRTALVGYCVGARLALLTAGTYPDRIEAAAGFHGGRLATADADSPHLVASRITAPIYFGHADADPSLPPEQIRRLDEALTAAGVRHRSEVYPGAQHGFTQADTDAYDKEADDRHWEALLNLLRPCPTR
ncbi:dienelactone hydrolase family protein [Streptomyces sp. NPDC086082]|uniref:dienelactone hydrolase family protein n=1 Tax=Streptomyces sp. NPDC086082 TaxID=3365750 RepID=UPI0037FA4814